MILTAPATFAASALAAPAFAAPALAAPEGATGAACQPGQGVTVAVAFAPIRDSIEIRCAPAASGTIGEAFAAAGFVIETGEWGMVVSIDGAEASELGAQGWWGLFISTTDGWPTGPAASDWQIAQVGASGGPVATDQAYFYRLYDSYSATDDPQLTLAEVLGRQGTAPVAPPDRTTPAEGSAAAAAGWLGRQLAESGDVLTLNGAPDWGLTIDALLALAATGVGGDQAAATAARLRASGEDYIGGPDGIAQKWSAVAKLTLALQVAGLDTTAFPAGGATRDLVADLRGAMNADGSFGASDAAFSHALALIALARTSGGVPPAALTWLEAQQCADADDPNYGSFGWSPGCGFPDADATAMAINGLIAAGSAPDGPAAAAAAWLVATQEPEGGFPSSFSGANANTSGLSALALALAGGHDAAVGAAAGYVGGLQVTCAAVAGAGSALTEANLGAIALDQAGLDQAISAGLDQANADQFRRATAQGVLGLNAPGFTELTLAGAEPGLPAATCAGPSSSPPASASPPPSSPAATMPETGPAVSPALPVAAALAILVGAALVAQRRRIAGQAPESADRR
ncbi:MAG: hypothetical protein LBG60_10190 [Bifidobacteriaceae bacterium]|nr:hypothetical protein [Bifidobacteriaceae bacterium]